MPEKPLQLYSVSEAATFLCVSAKTMWRLIYARRIATVRIGRRVLVSSDAINEFIQSATQEKIDCAELVRRILG